MLSRIVKTGSALLGAQGIILVSQLVLPPLFLHKYGVAGFGEWLALSAAASYLGTVNFGLQNFANTQVTIHHSRGETEEVNAVQATAFATLLAIVAVLAALLSVVFRMPLSGWLHLGISSQEASLTVYLLGLQILVRMIFGFLQGSFLVVGKYHRGAYWSNALWIAGLIATVVCIFDGRSFSSIAAWQLIVNCAFCFLIAADLRLTASVAFPRLSYVQLHRVMPILKPSGHFGMLFSASFLVYQLPIIFMQRMLGPGEVVAFSVTRTIYSMARQLLTSLSAAIGPEIVELYGVGNWRKLLQLYNSSERIVFALIPVVAFGTFLATPVAMSVWLHKPQLYRLDTCLLMALISAVAGLKEHKYQFQISVNQHSEMARFIFATYLGMVALIVPAIWLLGVNGFLLLWLATETLQTAHIIGLNQKLFAGVAQLELSPLVRLTALVAAAAASSTALAVILEGRGLTETAAVAVVAALVLAGLGYQTFNVRALQSLLLARFHKPAMSGNSAVH